jgi:RecB family exonuclease
MPYADPQADWGLAQAVTRRVRDGVRGAIFSYARRVGGLEMGASRLMLQELGEATKMPEAWRRWAAEEEALTEEFADGSEVAYPLSALRGGAAALTWQSNCAFKAFGLARLAAERREAAEAGLSARERGNLLHAVLHRVWGGRATSGTVSLAELQAVADWPAAEEQESRAKLAAFVRPHARAVLEGENRRLGERLLRFPLSFRELEVERLTVLVTEWLMLECERQPFRVAETEVGRRVKASGLDLQLRLDRIDELDGGRRLVVDYKTGDAKPAMWKAESPEDRPEDVQLPLYAVFAQDFANEADLEGLVLAKVRPGKMEFAGRMRDARAALLPGLASAAGLVKDPLTDGQLAVWREVIERLGREFGQGVAAVDPKDPRKTCEACHLHAVCRIYEQRSLAAMVAGDGEDGEGADGEGGDE